MVDEQELDDENFLRSLDLDEVIVPELKDPVNAVSSWHNEVRYHCDQLITKIRKKEEEVKQMLAQIEESKASMIKKVQEREKVLEDNYQKRYAEVEEKKVEFNKRKEELEKQYALKIQVSYIASYHLSFFLSCFFLCT